jgi:hypothetical protein
MLRHGIERELSACGTVRPICEPLHEVSFNRIGVNVLPSCMEVVGVAHCRFMEARLPDLHFLITLQMNLVRASALDELHRFFKRGHVSRRQEQVQMIGHHNKFMEMIGALIPIVENALNEDVGIFGDLKNRAALPGLRCDEVSASA